MSTQDFPFDEYCARVGVEQDSPPTVDRLEELQRAQLYSIPFENFDIQLGRSIDLTPEGITQKLLRSRRGGYCFELNGLFEMALEASGYEVRTVLARAFVAGNSFGRGHQAEIVTVDGQDWLVDVGYGGACPRVPVPLSHGVETDHDGTVFRLIEHDLGWMLQRQTPDGWLGVYSFDLMPVVPNDILYGHHFTSTHPTSLFNHSRVAVLCHPDGETRLLNHRCTTRRTGVDMVEELPDDERYLEELSRRFGIDLDAEYHRLSPVARRT